MIICDMKLSDRKINSLPKLCEFVQKQIMHQHIFHGYKEFKLILTPNDDLPITMYFNDNELTNDSYFFISVAIANNLFSIDSGWIYFNPFKNETRIMLEATL